MRCARAVAPLVLWLSLLSAVLLWLHRQGGLLAPPHPAEAGEWMAVHGPEVALMVVLRLGCLAAGWYLLVVTCGAIVARCLQAQGAVRVVESITPPLVRRLVSGIAGVALTATATTVAPGSPAVATSAVMASAITAAGGGARTDPVTSASGDGSDDEPTMLRILDGSDEGRRADQPAGQPVEMRMLPPQPDPEPAATGLRRHTVVAGDHFWSVAESELLAARSRPVSDKEIDPYWRLLVDTNRAEVLDPDLLFPGQVVVVPPVPTEATGD